MRTLPVMIVVLMNQHKGTNAPSFSTHTHTRTHAHTHTFNGPFLGLPRWAGSRKVKPIWILLKQETVNGNGISWATCKSAPHSRQITMPAPHHSAFSGQMPFLPPNQQRQSTEGSGPIKNDLVILPDWCKCYDFPCIYWHCLLGKIRTTFGS